MILVWVAFPILLWASWVNLDRRQIVGFIGFFLACLLTSMLPCAAGLPKGLCMAGQCLTVIVLVLITFGGDVTLR